MLTMNVSPFWNLTSLKTGTKSKQGQEVWLKWYSTCEFKPQYTPPTKKISKQQMLIYS
jgi:hypothetical protein